MSGGKRRSKGGAQRMRASLIEGVFIEALSRKGFNGALGHRS